MSRARLAAAVVLAICAGACTRAPTPAELQPLLDARPARSPLPDDAERMAVRVAAAALAGRADQALSRSAALEREEKLRDARGEPPSGLVDNAAEIVAACDGSDAFPAHSRDLLARGDLDPAIRLRLERMITSDPLESADADLAADRRFKAGALVNRIVEPASKLLLTGLLNPIDATRTVLATLLTAHKLPQASVRERRALRAWDDWLARHPEDPRAPEVSARAQRYRAKLEGERYERALAGAEEALEARELERARILAGRALGRRPESEPAAKLFERASAGLAARDAQVRSSLQMHELAPPSLEPSSRAAYHELAREALVAAAEPLAARAESWRANGAPLELGGELAFLSSFGRLARGDEDGFFATLREVPELAPKGDSVSRQAVAILTDPDQNPYAVYRAAATADRRARLAWLALGPHANGPRHRDLPRPLEYLLDLPGAAISLVTFPLRLIQYPNASARFGSGVLIAGERYTVRRPHGQHAREIDRDLASRYAARGQFGAALRHEQALADPDPERIASHREKIAEQMLAGVDREQRVDMKLALLVAVAREYPETESGARARERFIAEKRAVTPQRIRLTHGFLVEHPELWAPGMLGLNSELLDGAKRNGEIAATGVVLVGRSAIEISLEGRDPALRQIPPDDFARFAARLEQISYASLTRDPRESPSNDAARDAFLASARLGSVDAPDLRPSARSEAVYRSTHEKHGFVNARESILPVDLVLQGGLESLGLAAFPRIRLPKAPADALLYD